MKLPIHCALLALAFAACGDSMTDRRYQGDPLYTVKGQLLAAESADSALTLISPRVGIAWLTEGDVERPVIPGTVAPVAATSFPAQFQINLFDPPPAAAMMPFEQEEGTGEALPPGDVTLALGVVWAVDDVNRDQRFDTPGGDVVLTGGGPRIAAPDRIFGLSEGILVSYWRSRSGSISTLPDGNGRRHASGYGLWRYRCLDGELTYELVDGTPSIDIRTFAPAAGYPPRIRPLPNCEPAGGVTKPAEEPANEDDEAIVASAECKAFCDQVTDACPNASCDATFWCVTKARGTCRASRLARLRCEAESLAVTCEDGGWSGSSRGPCSDQSAALCTSP